MAQTTIMQSRHTNHYIASMKQFTPYAELSHDVAVKLTSKIKNHKSLLTSLRELCLHSNSYMPANEELSAALLHIVKETANLDIEKKIIRVCYYLLTDMVFATNSDKILPEVMRQLQYEISHAEGARLCLAWRLLSRIVHHANCSALIEHTLLNSIKSLKKPVKEKKGLLGNRKTDFEQQLLLWSSHFSALRRAHITPPQEFLETLFAACEYTNVALARHAYHLLAQLLRSHAATVATSFIAKLKQGAFLSRASSDIMTCMHLLEACQTVIKDVNSTAVMVQDLMIVVFQLLGNSKLKIRLEASAVITDALPLTPAYLTAVANIGGADVISRLTTAIVSDLELLVVPPHEDADISGKVAIGGGDITLSPLCRAVVRLGRYVLLLQSSSQTAEEAKAQEALVRPLGKALANMCRAFQQSSVFLPHARCDVLKAVLWILPLHNGYVKEHAELWAWFTQQVLMAVPCIGEDLAENLVMHVLGRLRDTHFASETLIELAIKAAEVAVRSFDDGGGTAVGSLMLVWTRIAEYGEHQHARMSLLNSLLRVIDGALCSVNAATSPAAAVAKAYFADQNAVDTTSTFHNFLRYLGDESKLYMQASHAQELRSLRNFAYWALGKHAALWALDGYGSSLDVVDSNNMFIPPTSDLHNILFDFTAATTTAPPLVIVTMRLLQAAHIEQSRAKAVCLDSLFLIAVQLPPESALQELIRDEMHAHAAHDSGLLHNDVYCEIERLQQLGVIRGNDSSTRKAIEVVAKFAASDVQGIGRDAMLCSIALESVAHAHATGDMEERPQSVRNPRISLNLLEASTPVSTSTDFIVTGSELDKLLYQMHVVSLPADEDATLKSPILP